MNISSPEKFLAHKFLTHKFSPEKFSTERFLDASKTTHNIMYN